MPELTTVAPEHAPLVAELLAKYTLEELKELAGQLPPDEQALSTLYPSLYARSGGHDVYRSMMAGASVGDIAAYVASAGQHGMTKMLNELLARQRQVKASVDLLLSIKQGADERGAKLFVEALSPDLGPGMVRDEREDQQRARASDQGKGPAPG